MEEQAEELRELMKDDVAAPADNSIENHANKRNKLRND